MPTCEIPGRSLLYTIEITSEVESWLGVKRGEKYQAVRLNYFTGRAWDTLWRIPALNGRCVDVPQWACRVLEHYEF